MRSLESLLDEFKEKSKDVVSDNRFIWEGTEEDDLYSVDIHIWRKPGMGNSLQTIAGNELSIMTSLTSFFQTLLDKEILDESTLLDMVKMAGKGHRGEL